MKNIDLKNPATVWKVVKYSAIVGAGIISVVADLAESRCNSILVKEEAGELVNAMTADAIKDQMNDVVKDEVSKQLLAAIKEMAKSK